jgi:hypothetical protein
MFQNVAKVHAAQPDTQAEIRISKALVNHNSQRKAKSFSIFPAKPAIDMVSGWPEASLVVMFRRSCINENGS